MSTHSSIPTDPSSPMNEEGLEVSCAPRHPVPCMQAAFEESISEQGHHLPSSSSYAITAGNGEALSPSFIPRYHPLTKLIAQITFGIHLLHKRLAKSDSEVVRILQSHVNDMDSFLSTTTHDFDLAKSDISARIKNLQVPLENGPASEVFESMLRDPAFRAQIMEGNKKVEYVIKRTGRAMNRALEDVGQGLRAVDELAKYLLTLKTGWKNANLVRVYGAMTHNVEGWFRCFVGLQMKGQVLGEKLNQLKTIVWEIERRCGRVSRWESIGGRNSIVIKKRQSLNLIPENPAHESQDTNSSLNKLEKPLPSIPFPTSMAMNSNHALWPKHHPTESPSENRKSALPKQTLSKRRSVSGPLPIRTTSLPRPDIEAIGPEKLETKVPEPSPRSDEKEKDKQQKKKHRRSQSSVTLMSTHTDDVTGTVSKSASLTLSLRRSLSLGRSSKKEKEKRVDKGTEPDRRDPLPEPATLVPPVPPIPTQAEQVNQDSMEHSSSEKPSEKEDDREEPKAEPGDIECPAAPGASQGTSPCGEGVAQVKKKKSRGHLHYASGHYAALQKRKSASSIASSKFESTGNASQSSKDVLPPVPSVPPVPTSTSSPSVRQAQDSAKAETGIPKSHSRRHSVIGSAGGSVLNTILSLRPKSRHGTASNKEQSNNTREVIPPVPALPSHALNPKTSRTIVKSKSGTVLSKQKPSKSQASSALVSGSTILKSVKELQDSKNGNTKTGLESKYSRTGTGLPKFKLEDGKNNAVQSGKQPTLIKEPIMKDIKLSTVVTATNEKTGPAMRIVTTVSSGNPNSPNPGATKSQETGSIKGTRSTIAGTTPAATSSPKSSNKGFFFRFFNDRSF